MEEYKVDENRPRLAIVIIAFVLLLAIPLYFLYKNEEVDSRLIISNDEDLDITDNDLIYDTWYASTAELDGSGEISPTVCKKFRAMAKKYSEDGEWFDKDFCNGYVSFDGEYNTISISIYLSDETHVAKYELSKDRSMLLDYKFYEGEYDSIPAVNKGLSLK